MRSCRPLVVCSFGLLAFFVALSPGEAVGQFFRVSGQVAWEGNTVVPVGSSQLVIELVEMVSVSRMETVARRSVRIFGEPQAFSAAFAERNLRPGRSYALNFSIEIDGKRLYSSPRPIPVTATGFRNRTVDLVEVSAVQGGTLDTTITLSGSVSYLEKVAMPEGSFLTFELQEKQTMHTWTTLEIRRIDSNRPPVDFSFSYDTASWLAGATHRLMIYWKDDQGNPWFATPQPIPVTFAGWPEPKEIRLTRVAG